MKRVLSTLAFALAAIFLAAGPSTAAPFTSVAGSGVKEPGAHALVQPVHKRWRNYGRRYVAPRYGYGVYYGYRPRYYAPYAYYFPAPRYYGYYDNYAPSYGYYYSRKHRDWDDDDWDDD